MAIPNLIQQLNQKAKEKLNPLTLKGGLKWPIFSPPQQQPSIPQSIQGPQPLIGPSPVKTPTTAPVKPTPKPQPPQTQPDFSGIQNQLDAIRKQALSLQTLQQSSTPPQTPAGTTPGIIVPPLPKEDQLSRIQKELIASQQPTEQETTTEQQLANLLTSRELGLAETADKPIAMPFITGQQAAIERRAAVQAMPLQARLGQLQAKRQAAIDVAKTKLGIEGIEAERMKPEKPIEVGGRLVSPTTGKVIYEPPAVAKELKAPTTMETAQGIMQWDAQTGQWKPTGFVKPTPTGVLEKQAEKAIEKQEAETAKQQQATTSLGVVNDLLSNPSLTTIFGYIGGRIGGIVPGKAQLAINQYDQLKAQLALGARQLLKGSGQISDYESRVLNQSTTALGRTLSDKDAVQSLKNIRGVLRTNIGQETSVRVYDTSGKIIGEGNLTGKDIFDAVSDGNRVEYQ